MNIKKLSLILIVLLSFACASDDDEGSPEIDKTALFLEETIPQFNGKLDDFNFSWEFGFAQYQMSSAFFSINGVENPERYLRFVLNQENGDNQFVITTPIFNSSTQEGFDSILSVGEKSIGTYPLDYELSIRNNGIINEACEETANYKLEVLKTEIVPEDGPSGNKLLVWFKLDEINFNDCQPNLSAILSDGFILAQFYGFAFEE